MKCSATHPGCFIIFWCPQDWHGGDDAETSKSFVKDLDNIRRQDFLLQVDLEDPDIAREHWIGLRSKTFERFGLALMHGPLWD